MLAPALDVRSSVKQLTVLAGLNNLGDVQKLIELMPRPLAQYLRCVDGQLITKAGMLQHPSVVPAGLMRLKMTTTSQRVDLTPAGYQQ